MIKVAKGTAKATITSVGTQGQDAVVSVHFGTKAGREVELEQEAGTWKVAEFTVPSRRK